MDAGVPGRCIDEPMDADCIHASMHQTPLTVVRGVWVVLKLGLLHHVASDCRQAMTPSGR